MTTKMFNIEFYDITTAEDSDPDPLFHGESDNTDDLFVMLSEYIADDVTYVYADIDNKFLRYVVWRNATRSVIGTAIVEYP